MVASEQRFKTDAVNIEELLNGAIPKKIFYCWFGGKSLNDDQRSCINSWKKFLPEHEIIEINETNFPYSDTLFGKMMYEAKLFSYLTDYIRLRVIYENGGIYFDTDVTLIKNIDDILQKGPYFGECAEQGKIMGVQTGLGFACFKGHPLLKALMEPYERWNEKSAFTDNGFPNIPACPVFNLPAFISWGFVLEKRVQTVKGVTFYTPDYFEPIDFSDGVLRMNENTRSIHHYTGYSRNPLDKWYSAYSAALSKRKKRRVSDKELKLHMLFLHPIKLIRYRNLHKRKKSEA